MKRYFDIALNHLDKVKKAKEEISKKELLKAFNINDFENIKLFDTFIFRYIKLQDYIASKIFKKFLEIIGENSEGSFLDILDRLEKLGFISSSKKWIKIRHLRNKIAHEYPEEEEELKEDLFLAIEYLYEVESTLFKMINYLKEKGLYD